MAPILIAIVVPAVLALAIAGMYNSLVRERLHCDEAWAQVEVQLKRRHDLIPNLVNAVKGYMDFEQDVLTKVTEARANAVSAGARGPAPTAQAENALTGTLRSLFAVMENYPQLKANGNVAQLQADLSATEDQLSISRQSYNAAVLAYNTAVTTIPRSILAAMLGFARREFFAAEPGAEAVPEVGLR